MKKTVLFFYFTASLFSAHSFSAESQYNLQDRKPLGEPKTIIVDKAPITVTDEVSAKKYHYMRLGKPLPQKTLLKTQASPLNATGNYDDPAPYYRSYEPYFNEGKIFVQHDNFKNNTYHNFFVGNQRNPTKGNPFNNSAEAYRYSMEVGRKMLEASFYIKKPMYWYLSTTPESGYEAATSVLGYIVSDWMVKGLLKEGYSYNAYMFDLLANKEYRSITGNDYQVDPIDNFDALVDFADYGDEYMGQGDYYNTPYYGNSYYDKNSDMGLLTTTVIHEGLHAFGFLSGACRSRTLCPNLDRHIKDLFDDAVNISQPIEAHLYDTSIDQLESIIMTEPRGIYSKLRTDFLSEVKEMLTDGIATNGLGVQLWSEPKADNSGVDPQSLSHLGRFVKPTQLMDSYGATIKASNGKPHNIGAAAYVLCQAFWCMDETGAITGNVIDIDFKKTTPDINFTPNDNITLSYTLTNNSVHKTDIKVYFDSPLAAKVVNMPSECQAQPDELGRPYITCEYQNIDNTTIKTLDFVINADSGYYPIEAIARVNRHDVDIDGENNLAFSLLRIGKTKKPFVSVEKEYKVGEKTTTVIAPAIEWYDTPQGTPSFSWQLPDFQAGVTASVNEQTGELTITTDRELAEETYELLLTMRFSGKDTVYKTTLTTLDNRPNFPKLNYYYEYNLLDNKTSTITLPYLEGVTYQWVINNPDPELISISEGANGELVFIVGKMPKGSEPYVINTYFNATFDGETRSSENITITISRDPDRLDLEVSVEEYYSVTEKESITITPDVVAPEEATAFFWELSDQGQSDLISVEYLDESIGQIKVTASEVNQNTEVMLRLLVEDISGGITYYYTSVIIQNKTSGGSTGGNTGGSTGGNTSNTSNNASASSGGGSFGYLLALLGLLFYRRRFVKR